MKQFLHIGLVLGLAVVAAPVSTACAQVRESLQSPVAELYGSSELDLGRSARMPASRMKLNGSCTEPGCVESFDNTEATSITMDGCSNSNGGSITWKRTWTKNSDGTYTLKSSNEEFKVETCPMS